MLIDTGALVRMVNGDICEVKKLYLNNTTFSYWHIDIKHSKKSLLPIRDVEYVYDREELVEDYPEYFI